MKAFSDRGYSQFMSLVPQKRMDKNGRLVTRHVKDTGDTKLPKVPAPKVVSQSRKKEVPVDHLTDLIMKTMGFDQDGWEGIVDVSDIRQTVESYSDQLVERLIAAWKPRSQLATALGQLVYQEEPESVIREFGTFGGMVAGDDTTGMTETVSFIRALHEYPELPQVNDYSKADDHTKQGCRAIIKATQALEESKARFGESPVRRVPHDYDSHGIPLLNGSIVGLLVERPDEADRIIEVALERRTTDAGAIAAALDHGTQSLSSGAL